MDTAYSSSDHGDDNPRTHTGQGVDLDPPTCYAIVEAAGNGICITSTDGEVSYLNSACCRLFEVDGPEQVLGRRIWDLVPHEIEDAIRTRILTDAENGISWGGDMPVVTAMRKIVHTTASVTPIPSDGTPVRFVAWLFTDMSAVHDTLVELGRSKNFLLNIINAIADPIIVKNSELQVVMVNDSAAKLLGVPKHELVGELHHVVKPPEIAKIWQRADRLVLVRGNAITLENTLTIDDRQREFSVYKSRLVDPDSNQQYVISVLRDMTEIKVIERELTTYREHLEVLVAQRTSELQEANRALETEIAERRNAEESLRQSELAVADKASHLEETNIALKVLLDHQDDEKQKLGEAIAASVHNLVTPYLERLRQAPLDQSSRTLTEIIATNLTEIVKPFAMDLSAPPSGLSSTEIQVAKLTADGKTAKEIADIMVISENTVKVHKRNIRKKLGIRSSGANLRSYLRQIFERGMTARQ